MNWLQFLTLVVIIVVAWWENRSRIKELNIKLEERTTPYKQIIFSKRIEGYSELIVIMCKIVNLIKGISRYYEKYILSDYINFSLIKKEMQKSEDHSFEQLFKYEKDLNLLLNEYKERLDKWIIFFPSELLVDYLHFKDCFIDLNNLNIKKILEIYGNIFRIAYTKLGIELGRDLEEYYEKYH